MDSPTTEPYISDIQWMGGAAGKGGGQVKTGQNSDESRSLQGEGEEIHINWMAKAIISISAIRVQCSRQVSGSALDSILVLFLAFQL